MPTPGTLEEDVISKDGVEKKTRWRKSLQIARSSQTSR
jgi:hypothetical protein